MQKEKIIEAIESLQIQDDFRDFIEYISTNKVKLTGTGRLGFKDCFNINQKLYHSITTEHNRIPMDKFPTILFCFYVGQAAGIVRKSKEKSNTFLVVDDEAFEYFKSFNKVEQYFALLNNFWLNTQIDDLTGEERARDSVETLDLILQESFAKKFHPFPKKSSFTFFWNLSNVLRQLSLLGWSECIEDGFGDMKKTIVSQIKYKPLGKYLIEILCKERLLFYWNKYARLAKTYYIENNFFTGEPEKEIPEDIIEINLAKVENEVFEAPFQEELGDVLNKIWRAEQKNSSKEGNYIFKVSLNNKTWRRIAIASKDTFEDLHLIIQEAFDFDNDHLYAFYPSGKLYSGVSINSPWGQELPFADEIKLSDFELLKGESMLYLFDFGDHWEFSIELNDMNNEKPLKKPKIIESKGEAPEQYPDWDDDEDDY